MMFFLFCKCGNVPVWLQVAHDNFLSISSSGTGSLRSVIITYIYVLCFKEKMLRVKDLRAMNKKMKMLKVRKCVNELKDKISLYQCQSNTR